MRQIKFRGQDALGRWHYGALVNGYADDGSVVAYIATGLPVGTDDFEYFSVPLIIVRPDTVGQKSSWLDINDRPVYEGDVVELTMPDGTSRRFVVKYGTAYRIIRGEQRFSNVRMSGWFLVEGDDWLLPSVHRDGRCDADSIRVIGNVYDNPGLFND